MFKVYMNEFQEVTRLVLISKIFSLHIEVYLLFLFLIACLQ
jgi:hypothetical protein